MIECWWEVKIAPKGIFFGCHTGVRAIVTKLRF